MAQGQSGALRLVDVSIAIEGHQLLDRFSLSVAPGEIATVMGPSGCGKSSLLAYLCGTLDTQFVAAGQVWIGETELSGMPAEARRLGILFQDDLLFPHLSVAENLAFGLPPDMRCGVARADAVSAALEEAGLAGLGDRDPATLSGGQRARAALMRTLLSQPRALLLDEPFSKLDAALRDRIRRFVFEHARDAGLPTLLVTHDRRDAEVAGGPAVQLAPG